MVVPNPAVELTPLKTKDGVVVAYFVPAEEWDRLHSELASLKEQLATAVRERDHHLAKRVELLKTRFAPLPTEEEMATAVDNSHLIEGIIADLEARPE
jgi:hypothetical protein